MFKEVTHAPLTWDRVVAHNLPDNWWRGPAQTGTSVQPPRVTGSLFHHPIVGRGRDAFTRQKGEDREAHRVRMAKEMDELRETMRSNDAAPVDPHLASSLPPDRPEQPRKRPDKKRRRFVKQRLREEARSRPRPTVAVSYRSGFGYDRGTFTKGTTRANVLTAPPNLTAPERNASEKQIKQSEERAQQARDPALVGAHLDAAHGLFIPGGQDRDVSPQEQESREAYEMALVRRARNIGLPTLAVCGGSRALARGFGGGEMMLSDEAQQTHNQGLASKAHGLKLTPRTILGGAHPDRDPNKRDEIKKIDKINSTHVKVADLRNVPVLPGTGERELQVSARDEHDHPEGFETPHGAPIVGVTSHPEAIHGASIKAREGATDQGRAWSDDVLRGFEQSMQAYAGRRAVHRELLLRRKRL